MSTEDEVKLANLKIVYSEISELHSIQQQAVDLLINKFNWLAVIGVMSLQAILILKHANTVTLLLVVTSIMFSLYNLVPDAYKTTQKISDQLDTISDSNTIFLQRLVEKKRLALSKNSEKIDALTFKMNTIIFLLCAAFIIQLLPTVLRLTHIF